MHYIFFILFLLPFTATGQSRKKQKARTDSLSQITIKMMDRYNVDSNSHDRKVSLDTIFYNNRKIKAIGTFAVDRNNKKEDYKIGEWAEYYENGQIKSNGEYKMGFVLACRSATMGLAYYTYKIGDWTYYYENGQVMAKGKYDLTTQEVFTGIAKQYAKKSVITEGWSLYDISGEVSNDRQKIVLELEKTE